MASFPIVPSKTAMLFFDVLNIYMHSEDLEKHGEGGKRGVIFREHVEALAASGIVGRMQKMHRACRDAGIAIVHAQGDHRADGKDFWPHVVDDQPWYRGESPRQTERPALTSGSWGAEIIPELPVEPADYIIKKHRISAFFQTHLELSLRTAGINTILLSGGVVETGIASMAYSARDHDYSLVILRDACFALRPEVHTVFMDKVFPFFTRVMTVDQAIAQIQRT